MDVLRGRVKVGFIRAAVVRYSIDSLQIHNHCYEAVDLDNMVRITNEFGFSIAAFHHAHETYLVPDLLKETYGS